MMMVGSNIIGSNPIASSQEMFQSSFRLLVKRLKFWKKQTIENTKWIQMTMTMSTFSNYLKDKNLINFAQNANYSCQIWYI